MRVDEIKRLIRLVEESEIWLVYGMIEDHVRYTGSKLGERILDNWEHMVPQFVKVMPIDYKRVLAEMKKQQTQAVA